MMSNIQERLDYRLIADFIPKGSKVLDLGCGDGSLLETLCELRGVSGSGVEIDQAMIAECVRRDVPVYHGDVMDGLSIWPDKTFDVSILSQTLQQVENPDILLMEMSRVSKRMIISFPNFGHWLIRARFLWTGKMPKTGLLPHKWYNTPNIHLNTVRDFRELCSACKLKIIKENHVSRHGGNVSKSWANWRGLLSIFVVDPEGEIK